MFDRTGQTVRLRENAVPTVFDHCQRRSQNAEASNTAEPASDEASDAADDHCYSNCSKSSKAARVLKTSEKTLLENEGILNALCNDHQYTTECSESALLRASLVKSYAKNVEQKRKTCMLQRKVYRLKARVKRLHEALQKSRSTPKLAPLQTPASCVVKHTELANVTNGSHMSVPKNSCFTVNIGSLMDSFSDTES